ncbi:MAG: heavy-metal-associated domain-containing protein [Coriobacteriia bacterium]
MFRPLTHTFDLTKLLQGPYYCSGCAARVCERITAHRGVSASQCDLDGGTLSVTFDPSEIGLRDLESLVQHAALEAEDRVSHSAYRVTGLD